MSSDGFAKEFVEIGSFNFSMASFVDFKREVENASDVFASFGTSDEYRGKRQEIKVAFEAIENTIDLGVGRGFGRVFTSFVGNGGGDWFWVVE